MASWAIALYVVYLALAFGVRSLVQLRRTGSAGFRGFSARPAERAAGVLFVVGLVAGVAAPLFDVAGWLTPLPSLDRPALHVTGFVLFAAGLGATLAAQWAMGESWRIGVDAAEKTALVTHGPFALVRNPIFAAMLPTGLGLTLLVPNIVAVGGWIALLVALELQVRWVEEPYLLHTHGAAYRSYARRVGRFVPGVGRLA